jgi:hypothetical protein
MLVDCFFFIKLLHLRCFCSSVRGEYDALQVCIVHLSRLSVPFVVFLSLDVAKVCLVTLLSSYVT